MRALTVALAMAVLATPAAAEPVSLYAAGSLRGALTDMAKAFEAASGNTVQAKFGASGLLKDEITGGAKVDIV
jgi:molybdate transport system substrate-binding protein